MKIKVKDELNKINLKVSHQELVILRNALNNSKEDCFDVGRLNHKLFDKDELKSSNDANFIIKKQIKKIDNTLRTINPY
ncbi:hypothetical protein HOK00_08500 [bacterium]|jgi:hypothetical protein|nr:hypothetical protein [bacterium]